MVQNSFLDGSYLHKVARIIDDFEEGLVLPEAVVGGCLSTGKTTLVNNLLKIAPPAITSTPCPVFYSFKEKFEARIWFNKRFFLTADFGEMVHFLRTKAENKRPEKVELAFNHPLLKLCRLVDTPGIDSIPWSGSSSAEKVYLSASEIIYLFHQRGIQADDYQFLVKIKKERGPASFQAFSFWINCNTGKPDGTSLASTKKALKELFGSEIPVHALNTQNPKSVEALGTYLAGKLAARLFSRVEARLKEEDARLYHKLEEATGRKEESAFLLTFWMAREKAAKILAAKKEMAELLNRQLINAALQDNNRHLLAGERPVFSSLPEENERSWMPRHFLLGREGAVKGKPRPVPAKGLVVTAWGPFSSGKSTFLNAVMKEPVLPAEDRPTTGYLTRILPGGEKIAVVRFPRESAITISETSKKGPVLKRQELDNLLGYLSLEANFPEIAGIEVFTGSRPRKTKKEELEELLKETMAACSGAHRQKGQKKIQNPVSTVTLTFKGPLSLTYNLDAEREKFHRLLTGPLSCFISEVEVYHPAEIFRLAVFLDTPGIDSVFGRHRQVCLQALEETGLLLVFIHGKQLLSKTLQKEILENITGRAGKLVKAQKIFFLINFADTLTTLERERAANFVRRHLPPPFPGLPLFMISSAKALQGVDSGFERVLHRIREIASLEEIPKGACG